LAFADHDYGTGNKGDNDEHRWGDHDTDRDRQIQSVPDGGPGIILLTTAIGAVLLFGAVQRSRAKT